jgi:ABC-type uncharacterized transport system permease subunit
MIKRFQAALGSLSIPVLATILGLVAGSIFIAMAGISPVDVYNRLACEGFGPEGCDSVGDLIVVDVTNKDTGQVENHFSLFYGAKGHALALTLEQATPLILTALAATVAFKAGMFSIGMDGQFALGAVERPALLHPANNHARHRNSGGDGGGRGLFVAGWDTQSQTQRQRTD